MMPDIGNLFKFFKEPEYTLTLINDGKLHFQNPSKFERTIGEVNIGYRKGLEPFRLENIGVSCFTHSNECWKNPSLWETFAEGGKGVVLGFQETPSPKNQWLYHPFEKDTFVVLPRYTDKTASTPQLTIKDFPADGLSYIPVKSSDHREELEYRLYVIDFHDDQGFIKVKWSSRFYIKSVIFHEKATKSEIEDFIEKVNYSRPLRFWQVKNNSLNYLMLKPKNSRIGGLFYE